MSRRSKCATPPVTWKINSPGTHRFDAKERPLAGFEFAHVDGPFTPADNFQKYAGTLRYGHGDEADGYSLTAPYYHGQGDVSTGQPLHAVQEALIGRFGTHTPSDGTRNERYSLSAHYATHGDVWRLTAKSYFVHSKQTLFNDFKQSLEGPVNGDQEQPDKSRNLAGGGAALFANLRPVIAPYPPSRQIHPLPR